MPLQPLAPLEDMLAAAWPPADWSDVSILVAVSGGADSVALLHALVRLKAGIGGRGRLIVGHFNHRLRDEAAVDEAFVRDLAGKLGLNSERGEADVRDLSGRRGDGLEAAAREARYAFLQSAAERAGARYLAVAHTADDQVETVLLNIVRGTGLAGLAGIPRVRPLGPAVSIVRPLLGVRRSEVVDYLRAIGQDYRLDVTNECLDYARNRIRHELLPLLRSRFNPDVDAAIERLSRLAADSQDVIEQAAGELLDRCLEKTRPESVSIDTRRLQDADVHLVREALVVLWRRLGWPVQDMGFKEWNLLARMALELSDAVKRVLPGNVLAERRGDRLILTPQAGAQ